MIGRVDDTSVPAGWRAFVEALPDPALWQEIAASPAESPNRRGSAAISAAAQLVANLADIAGFRDAYAALDLPRGARVLDAACGPGVTSRVAAALGYDVTAVDLDPAMLDIARRGPHRRGIRVVEADLRRRLPWPDDHFDAVVVGDWWEEAFFSELERVLAPGGALWVRLSNIRPPVVYAHDPSLDSRVWTALLDGYRARFGDAGEATVTALEEAGFERSRDIAVAHDVRRPLVGYRFAIAFTLWESQFLRDRLDGDDWRTVLELWDPAATCPWWTDVAQRPVTWLSQWRWRR